MFLVGWPRCISGRDAYKPRYKFKHNLLSILNTTTHLRTIPEVTGLKIRLNSIYKPCKLLIEYTQRHRSMIDPEFNYWIVYSDKIAISSILGIGRHWTPWLEGMYQRRYLVVSGQARYYSAGLKVVLAFSCKAIRGVSEYFSTIEKEGGFKQLVLSALVVKFGQPWAWDMDGCASPPLRFGRIGSILRDVLLRDHHQHI